jgi:sarcosine oxidase subunit beta
MPACVVTSRKQVGVGPTYDAIVIGAGIIGNGIATEMSRQGRKTLNIEKLGGSGNGSTGYSSGK